ncbi:inositol monophosphatase family protein [Methylobacterium oxalidis]|uniref:3'(2'),5'-bisphosphate nucleotidase CysQ n=1 Tax=Methylobacterium oxalidis TaxID=944322 RepID=A0A512IXM5_9HYPH|nr:3'(2'),5'-bisphosphate nucleotidase CysQ [Methylobacterium oxalidis]GEP02467.1 3'(2'),5'-bisphosphate nucleotidase CysQ [Methylobacterium oxalidis]GJE31982.1 3'(2'),5'-bisphosphate nucleotidase CysQ [Methylobacterium oxalidis]GLS67846.1 3'(2'),5'-bisphosphate nucleotidase CysQ [Methylobacterium oxalidis]
MPDTMSSEAAQAVMPALREAIREAASLALPHFRPGEQTRARIWSKAGGSPVTEADVAVDAFLKVRLSQIVPAAAWLSEETRDDSGRLGADLVWIVDPIDGTRAFLSGHPDWSIAVGLLSAGQPVVGIVHAPASGHFYEAVAGAGARRDDVPIAVSACTDLPGARVTGPKPMIERLARGLTREGVEPDFVRIDRVPSLALRVARVAEGAIDVGLVSSDARDWDLAAADLILREAGGSVCDLAGRRTVYNRNNPVHGELVAVSEGLLAPVIAALTA